MKNIPFDSGITLLMSSYCFKEDSGELEYFVVMQIRHRVFSNKHCESTLQRKEFK